MTKEIAIEEYSKKSFDKLNILKGTVIFFVILWIITLVMIRFYLENDTIYIISVGSMIAFWISYNVYKFIKKNDI